ncbi:phage portal protein [Erysipelothrix anatis]|uniref:phage portal protein n=1 Tax=Erysipelothrix anatis TaxID=2683713 RepID=UPI00135A13E9|nr:phage portal protein [Erysipelothrix anatis]
MGIFNQLFTRSREDPPKEQSNIGYLDKSDFPSLFFQGYTPLDKHPEFVAGVDKVADLISNMTIHIMYKNEKGHEKRVRDGLSRKLDINPNQYMTRKTFINNIVRNLLLYGNQVTLPQYGSGYLQDLVPITRGNVSFNPKPVGYSITISTKEYKPDNVLHFVLNPDPNFPYKGMGHRLVLKDVLENLTTANKTKKAYMSQKYSPSMVIAVEADGDAKDWADTRDSIIDDYVSSDEAGRPMVIPSSMLKVESVKPLTLQDLAINDAVQIDKKTVAAVLGIPAFLLGVGDFKRDEYNNFIETKVKSIATIIQQEMTKKLIISDDMFIRLNHHSLLDYSLTEWAKIGKDLRAIGVMSGNEVRNKVGLEFDDNEDLNKYVMLENYLNVEDIGKQKKLDKGGE